MLGHHETVKLLAEKGATMMTNGINLTNGMGKLKISNFSKKNSFK